MDANEKFSRNDVEVNVMNENQCLIDFFNNLLNKKCGENHKIKTLEREAGIKGNGVINSWIHRKKSPKRHNLLRLAIAMKLDIEETTRLLWYFGYIFKADDEVDKIFKFCIENEIYDRIEIDDMLISNNHKVMFSEN